MNSKNRKEQCEQVKRDALRKRANTPVERIAERDRLTDVIEQADSALVYYEENE